MGDEIYSLPILWEEVKIGQVMNKTQKADKAYALYDEIREAKSAETIRYLESGKSFKAFRSGKYKDLGYESYNEFCADPEIGYNQKAIDTCIKVYETYVLHLDVPANVLCSIGHRRLQLILPLVSKAPRKWLRYAETWSYADLINAVRKSKGRDSMSKKTSFHSGVVVPLNYLQYVESCPCLLCGKKSSVKAHFPRTKKMGGEFVIPLCAECHSGQHGIGVDSFFSSCKVKIGQWLEQMIKDLIGGV